jgi:hypothetical protein
MRPTFLRAGLVLLAVLPLAGCPTDSSSGTGVAYFGYNHASCAASASPLPGYRTCSVTAAITFTKGTPSGTVSVYFNYPDGGSFYHGQASVPTGFKGSVDVVLTNTYVSSCPNIRTTVDIYDGPQSASGGALLQSKSNVYMGPLC